MPREGVTDTEGVNRCVIVPEADRDRDAEVDWDIDGDAADRDVDRDKVSSSVFDTVTSGDIDGVAVPLLAVASALSDVLRERETVAVTEWLDVRGIVPVWVNEPRVPLRDADTSADAVLDCVASPVTVIVMGSERVGVGRTVGLIVVDGVMRAVAVPVAESDPLVAVRLAEMSADAVVEAVTEADKLVVEEAVPETLAVAVGRIVTVCVALANVRVRDDDAVPRDSVTPVETVAVTAGLVVAEMSALKECVVDAEDVKVRFDIVTSAVEVAVGSADGDSEGLPRERDTVCSGVSVMVGSELWVRETLSGSDRLIVPEGRDTLRDAVASAVSDLVITMLRVIVSA
mgnify:CR=1 FL=1